LGSAGSVGGVIDVDEGYKPEMSDIARVDLKTSDMMRQVI